MADLWKGPKFQEVHAGKNDMNIASIAWGFSLGIAMFTFSKGLRQSIKSWQRVHKMSHYVILLWLEWTSSCLMSAVTWLYLRNYIPGGFPVFFVLIFLWCVQIQALIQIIINRIAILMVNRRTAKLLKIWSFVLILCINVSVFTIWIPARLQVNDTWVSINKVWDRIEKVLFLLIDAGLNLYFIHLVRSRLIANGLTKYTRLFHFNLAMIAVSISMDVILIAMMSLPSDIVYVQFHPLAYLVKLHIEMNMAELIIKVVKAGNNGSDPEDSKSNSIQKKRGSRRSLRSKFPSAMFMGGNRTIIEGGMDDIALVDRIEGGIQKTTLTEVVVKNTRQSETDDRDAVSDAGSTHKVQKENFTV